ncbi:acyl-[acyl-carrier-protein] thioesterase [Lacticigenium naphthae]|uniref:acyl-[acyl-carrier-protein] thioesterase n=1 Tax=Lacticigenium naphthae TaxID=515351 RepID=UPI0003F5DE27|nr:acyl-ACP thioesterase domain-containing protein [Lacticigenium naphthae]
MSGISHSNTHLIHYYECDQQQNLTLPMLVNLLLHVSGEHSEELGLSDDVLAGRDLSWVIIQYEMHIKRLPQFKETIKIETIARQYNKLFSYRDFFVKDEQGNTIIEVCVTFGLISLSKRKLVRLPENIMEPYGAEFSKSLVRTPRPQKVDIDKAQKRSYHVRYFDIDRNKHVNNSKYLEWTLDALDADFLNQHQLTYATMKFEKEVLYDEKVESLASMEKIDEQFYVTNHHIKSGEQINFTASYNWKAKGE